MATPRKTKSGKWSVLVSVPKEIIPSGYKRITADTKREAAILAEQFKAELTTGLQHITVAQSLERYIQSKKGVLSPATIVGYDRIRRTRLQAIMGVDIHRLTPEALQTAFSAEAAAGASPKSQQNTYWLLKAALSMFGVTAPAVKLSDKTKKEREIPTPQQVAQLLENAQGDFLTALLLASELGLSRSELCALTMADCKNGNVTINKAVVQDINKNWVVKVPKETARYRTIRMTPTVQHTIESLDRPDNERVVDLNPTEISSRFDRLCDKLFGRRYGLHSLRHYNVTLMLAAGMKPKYIIDRTGHATMRMVDTVYGHIMQDEKENEAEAFNQFLAGMKK